MADEQRPDDQGELDIVKMHGPPSKPVDNVRQDTDDSKGSKQSLAIDKAEAAGLPPDRGPEVDVISVRPAMFRSHPFIYLGMVVVGLLGLVVVFWKGLFPTSMTWLIAGLVLLLASVMMLGVWKIKTLGTSLRITNKRTVVIIGLFSRATSEVVHDNIRNIQVTQSFMQRVFRVGRLGLSSSGQDGIEIDVPNLPNPDRIREIIDTYRPL